MTRLGSFVFAFATLQAAGVDVYSGKDLQAMNQVLSKKATPFSSRDLARYGNHYLMLARRDATGSAEVHQREADVFVVEDGVATLLSGGKVVNPRTEKPGEIRGTSIQGGDRRELSKGDIVHIPAGIPHQLLLTKGQAFAYFVIKVSGQ